MAVMTCPRCGGCGEITQGENRTAAGICKTICPSCSGSGYVSDAPPMPASLVVKADSLKLERAIEDHYLKCPECGKAIRIQLGHYLVFSDTARSFSPSPE